MPKRERSGRAVATVAANAAAKTGSGGRRLIVAVALVLVAARAPAAEAPMRLDRLTFVASSDGITEILVEAETGVIDAVAQKAALRSVSAAWNGADGERSLSIECAEGELDLATNDLLATGGVSGVLADGRRFSGPWLRFDRERGVAFSRAKVRIIEGGRVLTGGDFEYHVRDRRLRLGSGARVEEVR